MGVLRNPDEEERDFPKEHRETRERGQGGGFFFFCQLRERSGEDRGREFRDCFNEIKNSQGLN